MLVFLIASAKRIRAKRDDKMIAFDVFERSGARLALRDTSRQGFVIGLMYSMWVLYIPSVILLFVRYTSIRAIIIILQPLVISSLISYVICLLMSISTSDYFDYFFRIFFILLMFLKPLFGSLLVTNDIKYSKESYISNGWNHIGSYLGKSESNAIAVSLN